MGGSNEELARIAQAWMGLGRPPPPNAKLSGQQVPYPVVGRVLVDAGELEEMFNEDTLAQTIEDADAASDLPDSLKERVGLCDGQALCLLEGLATADSPSAEPQRSSLPSHAELASAVLHTAPMNSLASVSRLRRAARDFARRQARLHSDDDAGGGGGGGSDRGGGEGDGGGSSGHGGGGEQDEGGGDSDTWNCELPRLPPDAPSAVRMAARGAKRVRPLVSDAGDSSDAAQKRPACETSSSAPQRDGEDRTCSICLETVDSEGVSLGCNHMFHHPCITQMIVKGTREQNNGARSRCPNCRAPIISMRALDKNGVRGHEIEVPEMAAAVADAERDGTELSYVGPRVHSGVARALRTLQSELHGVAPVRARRTG